MKLRFGKNPAMMTVELGVSLVLIVVVLFVVIGLFNDNIKSMIGSSNFSRLFSANGLKNFFQSFNRNYDDSQIYVQIMGEQGLEMLRKKANNSDLGLIETAKSASSTDPTTTNTIIYLANIIQLIVGDQKICEQIKNIPKPASATCTALGLGVKYDLSAAGNTLTIKDGSGNIIKTLTLTTGLPTLPTIADNATAKEKLAAIQTLAAQYNDSIDSNYAMTREINHFVSQAANFGGSTPGAPQLSKIEVELVNFLGSSSAPGTSSMYKLLSDAVGGCTTDAGLGYVPEGCAVLSDYDALFTKIFEQMQALMNSSAYTNTLVYLPSTQLPPAYKPTINADDNWYSANAADASLIEGSEDALLITSSKDDPLALLAPDGEEPIIQGASDAIYQCTPEDAAACDFCAGAGGIWNNTSGTCNCGSGEVFYLSGSNSACVPCSSGVLNGDGTCWVSGSGGSTGPTSCPAGQLLNDSIAPATCVTCGTVLDINGACCATGVLDSAGACCATGATAPGGLCATPIAPASPITVTSSLTANPVTVNYTSAVSGNITSSTSAAFDVGFVTGTAYMKDYYMSKLSGTDDASITARIKVLTIYNDLFRVIFNTTVNRGSLGNWTLGRFAGVYGKCSNYKTRLSIIASTNSGFGLTSMNDYFNTNTDATLCPSN